MGVYERDNISRLAAYAPGEQPQTGRWIKLNTNENPYPPSSAVMKAISGVGAEQLRRYPPPMADAFRRVAARVHRVSPDQIIATNGGDELLRLVVTVFCRPHPGARRTLPGGLGVAEPSYSLYPVLAQIGETPIIRVPLRDDWSLPADFERRIIAAGCRVVMLVNPHAPSGRCEPIARLDHVARALRRRKCVLLIDEAYVDFAPASALPLVRRDSGLDNVLILRSLSKGYSLAGLRLGYGIGHPDLIAALNKAKDSYPTDALAQAAAAAALADRAYARATWRRVIAERRRLTRELSKRGFVVPPSQSNFVLAAAPARGPAARDLYETLKKQGIFVRYFDQERLRDKLRISVGTPEQNTALLAALDAAGHQAVDPRMHTDQHG